MSTPYSITIAMSQTTVDTLTAQNFSLYGFKAVSTTQGGGAPVVWFKSTTFGLGTFVNWDEQYQAYTASSSAIANGQISSTNPYDIDLGQTLNVTGTSGTGSVGAAGTPLAISINNETSTPFTCGISQMQTGSGPAVAMPMCAFPLNGNSMDVIAPVEQVALMFATAQIDTGSVVYQAFTQGILVDLTSSNSVTVQYDINKGWSWDGVIGTIIPANASLVPFIIQTPSNLENKLTHLLRASRHVAS